MEHIIKINAAGRGPIIVAQLLEANQISVKLTTKIRINIIFIEVRFSLSMSRIMNHRAGSWTAEETYYLQDCKIWVKCNRPTYVSLHVMRL